MSTEPPPPDEPGDGWEDDDVDDDPMRAAVLADDLPDEDGYDPAAADAEERAFEEQKATAGQWGTTGPVSANGTGHAAEEHPQLTDTPKVTRLSDVQPRPVDWLWEGRLPKGKLVVLDGDPGGGKSTLMVDLAARISTGSPFPDGHRPEPGNVVLLSAEDAADDTIRPRLDAAGGDPARVVILDAITVRTGDDVLDVPPSLPGHLPQLEQVIRQEQAVLVVIDVLNAFLSSKVDGHRDQDIRGALAPLAAMAERTGACIVVIRHLNKAGGTNALYRGGGSIGIIGAARVGLLAAGDPDDETRRVLAVTKSNLAEHAHSLAYRLVPAEEHGCARVEWDGTTTHRANDLLALHDQDDDSTDAADVLAGLLADGPRWVKEVMDEGASAGFSKDQMKRAKRKLRVRSVKVGRPGDAESGWKWALRREREVPEGSEGSGSQDPAPFTPFVLPSGDEDDPA